MFDVVIAGIIVYFLVDLGLRVKRGGCKQSFKNVWVYFEILLAVMLFAK